MKSLLAPALLTLTSCLLGSCAHPDAGLYTSRRGEMLRISRSGHLEWSPLSKTYYEFQSVGVLQKPDSQGNRHLAMASANPRLGTSVHFSPDGKTIDVTWRSFQQRSLPKRQTHYQKQEPRSKF
jgi:hypothetical protein